MPVKNHKIRSSRNNINAASDVLKLSHSVKHLNVTIADLKIGTVGRIRLTELAKLANESLPTLYRKIKSQQLNAIVDTGSGRLFILQDEALKYLEGQRYTHDHSNTVSLTKMEHARKFKRI